MILNSSQYGLGDTILLTSVARHLKNPTVQLPVRQQRFEILFRGLANVDIYQEVNPTLRDVGEGHYALRKLRGIFGSAAENMDYRPIVYADKMSEGSKRFVENHYLRGKRNPVVICPFVAKQWSAVRDIPYDLVKEIIGGAKYRGETPIVVQDSDVDWGVETLRSLHLEDLICLMARCKKLYTANTGVYHLGVALGMNVECYMPPDSHLFQSSEWCYFNEPTIKHVTWAN